ncbi:MAG: DUF3426 domain-containing protein [Rhodospirillales bacterium]|nr:MAG: DUF3426 domain-containing protein [Rhodospirillales bacterium]
MIVTCPRCTTRYDVSPDAVGKTGRSVRCSHCGHQWTLVPELGNALAERLAAVRARLPKVEEKPRESVPPPAAPPVAVSPGPAPAAPPEDFAAELSAGKAEPGPPPGATERPAPVSADAGPAEAVYASQPQPAGPDDTASADVPEESEPLPAALRDAGRVGPAEPQRTRPRRSAWPIAAAVIAVVLIGSLAGLMIGRDRVTAAFPATAGFYALIGLEVVAGSGLDIRDVVSTRQETEAGEVLFVEGVVTNPGEATRPLPLIRIALFDAADDELQAITVSPDRLELLPGESINFAATLETPDPQARRVKVTFAPRRGPA